MSRDTDAEIIADLLTGEPKTVDLVSGWIRGAFTPYRSTLSQELEDVEQEALLALRLSLQKGEFDGRCTLRTFVKTFVHHKCIDRLRARSRRQWVDVEDLDLPAPGPSGLDRLSQKERMTVLLEVLEETSESCRQLWSMLEKGMRYEEMSRELGVSENALRARVLRCRRRALQIRDRLLSQKVRNKTRGPATRENEGD